MPTTRQVIARRIARITFGSVLLVGAACLLAATCSPAFQHRSMLGVPRLDATAILVLTWVVAALASLVAWLIALRLPFSGDPNTLFAESLMVPAAGIALLLPLTLHLPVVVGLADREAFDIWVMVSVWITGLAHLVFATMSALRGYQLVAGKPAWSPRKIYVATVLTSCLPFLVLYAIPPALVALTGLPFIPLLRAMDRLVTRERQELAGAPHVLPRAIATPVRRA
ncbi:MAG TPA: hypothetical protein VFK02_04545 [Kofleriaceae bacterium]|nr:hypothetical protein [Kofleriaceae bacterium]